VIPQIYLVLFFNAQLDPGRLDSARYVRIPKATQLVSFRDFPIWRIADSPYFAAIKFGLDQNSSTSMSFAKLRVSKVQRSLKLFCIFDPAN
jgi:hypothetical protein